MNNYSKNIATLLLVEHEKTKKYMNIEIKSPYWKKYGIILNHKRIRRYKQNLGIIVKVRRLKSIYHQKRTITRVLINKVDYLLHGDFKTNKPRTKLSSDVSYINCLDGRIYLSAIKDLFNNEIIAFHCSDKNDVKLVINTFKKVKLKLNAIVNTDQGSAYYSHDYVKLALNKKFIRSMSHKCCCWKNAPIENWFSQLKSERYRKEK